MYALISTPQLHANIILAQDIMEYAALFSEIADAYFEREMYADAGHIYEMLGADAGVRVLFTYFCLVYLNENHCRPAAFTFSFKLQHVVGWLVTSKRLQNCQTRIYQREQQSVESA